MPELDRFEGRLAAAVRAFADRAETSVDAAAVAQGMGSQRGRVSLRWLGRPLPLPVSLLIVLGLLLGLLAWSVGGGAPWNQRASVGPVPAPSASTTATERALGTPVPSTDAAGPEYVTGTETVSVVIEGTDEVADQVRQIRGQVIATVDTTNDPRVTGIGTIRVNSDVYATQANGAPGGSVATTWGTYRLQNRDGAWEGVVRGAAHDGAQTNLSGWLVGNGAYEGLAYYFHAWGSTTIEIDGVILPGAPPAQ